MCVACYSKFEFGKSLKWVLLDWSLFAFIHDNTPVTKERISKLCLENNIAKVTGNKIKANNLERFIINRNSPAAFLHTPSSIFCE